MADEIIEGAAVEAPTRAVAVVQQPGQTLVANGDYARGPSDMVEVASHLATVLKHIVERQQLYTVIQGKKYPQVEAWMTIGRLDNVVAREAGKPTRNEDGSWEAVVELVRLSDGMVVGNGSAMCGAPDDPPWGGMPAKNGKPAQGPRAEHARRSMAVTRATSRAFRQQYSWIMALAGYEPTPADEMPPDDRPRAVPADVQQSDDGGLVGIAEEGDKSTSDFVARLDATRGPVLGFRLKGGKGGILVEASGALALQLDKRRDEVIDKRVTVWGKLAPRSFTPKGGKEITFQVLSAERVRVPEVGDLPTAVAPEAGITEAESEAIWDELEGVGA